LKELLQEFANEVLNYAYIVGGERLEIDIPNEDLEMLLNKYANLLEQKDKEEYLIDEMIEGQIDEAIEAKADLRRKEGA